MPYVAGSVKDLKDEIDRRINRYLKDKGVQIIHDELQKSIQEVVYDAYEPIYYDRRGSNGGYIDPKNYVDDFENCKVAVHNDTAASKSGLKHPLDKTIEEGYGAMDKPYNRPRPAIAVARDAVKARKEEIIDGLEKYITGR